MTERYLDNPAGRLYEILRRIKGFPRPNAGLREALPEILCVDPPLPPDVARAVGELLQLPSQAQREVEDLTGPGSKERLLRWLPNVTEATNVILFQMTSPPAPIGQVADKYNDGDMMSLEFCSEALHLDRPDLEISEDALKTLRMQISELLDLLEADNTLDPELRTLLLRNAREMCWAIQSYDRTGAAGLRAAFYQTTGAIVNNLNLTVRHDCSPRTWDKVIALLNAVAAVINIGVPIVTAIEAATSSPTPVEIVIQPRELPGTVLSGTIIPPTPKQAPTRDVPEQIYAQNDPQGTDSRPIGTQKTASQ